MGQVVDKGDSYKTHAVLGRCLHGMFVCVAYLCSTQLKDTHWTRVEMQPDSGGAVSECVCVCVSECVWRRHRGGYRPPRLAAVTTGTSA